MSGPYDDIIHLPHPTSRKHPRMPVSDRAAIFSPFAALAGHEAALAETARLTEPRMELDEDARAELDRRQALLLEHIKEQPELSVTWFQPDAKKEGGAYRTTTGRLKMIDSCWKVMAMTDGTTIPLEDVAALESACFKNNHDTGERSTESAALPLLIKEVQGDGKEKSIDYSSIYRRMD